MKNKVLRKVLIYAVSVMLVAGLVGGFMAVKATKEQAELEATFVEPIPVMTQEDMEALYDQNKTDSENIGIAISNIAPIWADSFKAPITNQSVLVSQN